MTTPLYHRTYVRYADVLEAFISKYKSRPPDIKFWPYGPYWPADSQGPAIQTPHHIRIIQEIPEPLYNPKLNNGKFFHSQLIQCIAGFPKMYKLICK